jgi:carbon monoxide dehydrogenase subunit G
MKFNGSYTFHTSRENVFAALLDPARLQTSIPGCTDAWYSAEHGHMKVRIETPVPGLEGPYDITVSILESITPAKLVIQAGRNGRIGGKITTMTQILLTEEGDGALLTYDTTAELEGPVAAAGNPLFQGLAKHSLKTFFKNLNASLEGQPAR